MTKAFDASSTADDVLAGVDLRGKRYLVTGVSSGIGTETARALAARGATVGGTVRSGGTPDGARVELDLASLASVRAGAEQLVATGRPFDGIIANAGIMAVPFGRTVDGFELQLGTNHLGHFVLVNRLRPVLRAGSRIVVLSSNGHRGADVDLEDPGFDRSPYDPWTAYGRSKTANALFALELDRRLREEGIRACAVMPGTGQTSLMKHLSKEDLDAVMKTVAEDRARRGDPPLKEKTPAQLAATSVWAAVVADADAIGGRYLENCHVAKVDDVPGIGDGVRSYALDPERARLLWKRSEELVGETFPT